MVVCKNVPFVADYKSGAEASLFIGVLGEVVKKPVEKIIKRVLTKGIGGPLHPFLGGDCFGRADVYD
jgi:hypothetical protein